MIGEPRYRLGPVRQTAVLTDRSPERLQRPCDLFEDVRNGGAELREVRSKAFQKSRPRLVVVVDERDTTAAGGKLMNAHGPEKCIGSRHLEGHRDLTTYESPDCVVASVMIDAVSP